jgi:hypothetical protein
VAGEQRRLHNKDLQKLYASQNIIQVIKSRRMGWARHVILLGEIRGEHSEDSGINGKILKFILGK